MKKMRVLLTAIVNKTFKTESGLSRLQQLQYYFGSILWKLENVILSKKLPQAIETLKWKIQANGLLVKGIRLIATQLLNNIKKTRKHNIRYMPTGTRNDCPIMIIYN